MKNILLKNRIMKRTEHSKEANNRSIGLIVVYAIGLTVIFLQLRSIFG